MSDVQPHWDVTKWPLRYLVPVPKTRGSVRAQPRGREPVLLRLAGTIRPAADGPGYIATIGSFETMAYCDTIDQAKLHIEALVALET